MKSRDYRKSVRRAIKPIVWHPLVLPLIRYRVSKAGCWFIDIPRTSSTSCKGELQDLFGWPYRGGNDLLNRFSYHLPHLGIHVPALNARRWLGHKLWQRIFTFSMVRNPWDRYLSFYMKNFTKSPSSPLSPSKIGQDFRNRMLKGVADNRGFTHPAEKYICDEDGNIIVDFVAKYENRQEDLAYVGEKINYPKFGEKYPLQRPTPKKYHYSEYYDSELRDLVAKIAKWEIEKFNYSFDTQIV